MGLLIHGFVINNRITNHDNLGALVQPFTRNSSGRWLQQAATSLSGEISIQFAAVFGIFYIAITSYIYVYMINNRICAILVASLLVCFPVISSTFLYMHDADGYMLSLLMSVIAVYCCRQKRFPAASVFLILSLACYQAYISLYISLIGCCVLLDILDDKKTWQNIIKETILSIIVLCISLTVHLISLKFFKLTDYKGMSSAGQISLEQMIQNCVLAYKNSIGFFLKNSWKFHKFPQRVGLMTLFGLMLYFIFRLVIIRRIYQSRIKLLLLVMVLGVLPGLFGSVYLLNAASVHVLMVYSVRNANKKMMIE